jgi:hypothetical protein
MLEVKDSPWHRLCPPNAAPEWQARSVGRSYERCGGLSTPGACIRSSMP